jgi:hypothetical protein
MMTYTTLFLLIPALALSLLTGDLVIFAFGLLLVIAGIAFDNIMNRESE